MKDLSWLWRPFVEAGKSGMGMFIESYFIFAVGNVHAIWQVEYPTCFDHDKAVAKNESLQCMDASVASVTYVEVVCIIAGMLFFGISGNRLGRRLGSRMCAGFMLVGAFFMLFSSGPTLTTLFVVFNIGLGLLSFGVGGEYPMTASSSAEASEHPDKSDYRGRAIGMALAMQGWGTFTNTLVLFTFVAATGSSACVPGLSNPTQNASICGESVLNFAWRSSYLVGIVFVLAVVTYRMCILKESHVWEKRQEELKSVHPAELLTKRAVARRILCCDPMYSMRLMGCSLCWLVWDISFYGTKLFQSTIIAVTIGGKPDLYAIFAYSLINATVALCGYYLCAFTVDMEWMGRTRMQAMGFFVMTILFLICGFAYDSLTTPANISAFQALYFLSTLFGQWGPNGTTFILPSELFPTDVRSTTHGIAASFGKLGALISTIAFTYGGAAHGALSPQYIFIVNGFMSLVGLVLTVVFIPNAGSVSLTEVDKFWHYKLYGKRYRGVAVHHRNLSIAEVWYRYGTQDLFFRSPSSTSLPSRDDSGDLREESAAKPLAEREYFDAETEQNAQAGSSADAISSNHVPNVIALQ